MVKVLYPCIFFQVFFFFSLSDDDPLGSKHVAVEITKNKAPLMVFTYYLHIMKPSSNGTVPN